jgi:hypothetical protein
MHPAPNRTARYLLPASRTTRNVGHEGRAVQVEMPDDEYHGSEVEQERGTERAGAALVTTA